jgi:tetratricopeptide (TPR) repeat protein
MNSHRVVALRVFLWAWFVVTSAFAQNAIVTEKAREHFKAGLEYLEEPTGAKYEEAYREFHSAYAESPSYKILNNIALCALYLERDGEAIDAYERYLAVAPKSEIPTKKREQIDGDLKRLKAGLVKFEIKVTPENAVIVDERQAVQGNNITNRYAAQNGVLSLGIHPGVHHVTVSAEGYAPQTWEFEAAPASNQARAFTLVALTTSEVKTSKVPTTTSNAALTVTTPPENHKTKLSTAFYVSAAATGLFAASATVTGLLALSKKSELTDLNEAGTDHAKAVSAHDDTKRYALFCDISLGATALAAGATAYFYFTAPKYETVATRVKPRLQLAPVVGAQQTGVTVFGSF